MDDVPTGPKKGKAEGPWTPQSIQVEQALLGAALVHPDAIQMVEGLVTTDDFAEPLHAHLWEVLCTAHRAGRRLDIKLLVSAIGPDAHIPIGSGMTAGQYVARLAAEATTVINARDYAGTIKDLADQRRIASIGASLRHEVKIDPGEIAAEAIEQLDQIVASRVNVGTPGLHMPEAAARAVDEIALAYQRDGAISGYTWGLKDLDHKTLGMQPGELLIIAGRPGMGKTAVGLTVARKTAEAGNRVLFESLEMRDTPLTQRMIADQLFDDGIQLPYWKMRSGRISEAEFGTITEAARKIALLPVRIEQRPALTVSQIAAQARQLKRRAGLQVVVVDHLHLVRASERYKGNKVNELGEISSGLKALAKELDVAVVALCQLSRGVEGRDDKRPNLGDLRGSGDIEQDADTVVMLFREAYYLERNEPLQGSPESLPWTTKMAEAASRLQAIVEKQRNGPIGIVNLFCNIACNAVRDLDTTSFAPDETQPTLGI